MGETTITLLTRYAAGERSFRDTWIEHPDALALDGETLAGADFSAAFLLGSFRRADLRGARFRDANVKTCDFSGADLTDADFRGAALEATTFTGAILTGASFAGAGLWGRVMGAGELPDW